MSFPLFFFAHAFGQTYTLPVPLWLFLFAAAAVVIVSFALIGLVYGERSAAPHSGGKSIRLRQSLTIGKFGGVLLLAITIITGLLGIQEPFLNFSVPFFWLVFLLGFTYLTAALGNVWSFINPFKTLFEGIEGISGGSIQPRLPYPRWLSYYPALLAYFALIWLELLAKSFSTVPQNLALLISGYAVFTLLAAFLFGKEVWFRYGEFFSVFFRLVSKIAPVSIRNGRVSLRWPLSGLLSNKEASPALLLFILFMLSSTGFDGLKETVPFWQATQLLPGFLQSNDALLETLALLLSPFFLLAVYLIFIALMKAVTRSRLPVSQLAYAFALSLIPIAVAYNIAHYFTLLLLPGQAIIPLISDPLGSGLNLFGTANYQMNETFLSAFAVWYTQVALIVVGHVAAVLASHAEALRLFGDRRQALISQVPMLVLMVLYTMGSLWIIAQPIAV